MTVTGRLLLLIVVMLLLSLEAGRSGFDQAQAAAQTVPPAAPGSLALAALSQSEIRLDWRDNSTNEAGFTIERSTGGGNFAGIATLGRETTTFRDSGLAAGTAYAYRVRAYNGGGVSGYSNTATCATLPSPPSAPGEPAAAPIRQTAVQLAWKDTSSSETGFRIERSTDGGATFRSLATTRPNTTSYKDSGLAAATRYTYRVCAFNAGGDSPFSASVSATTLPYPPAVPSGLAASALSHCALRLDWQDNSANETGFLILRQKDGDPAFAAVGTVGANVTTYTDTGLAPDTLYRYTVRAQNAGGLSDNCKVAQAVAVSGPPAAPDGLAVSILSDDAVELDWKDTSTNETGFRIERSTDGGATFQPLQTLRPNILTSRDLGLAGQTFYTYRVCAFNALGDSVFSAPAVAPMPSPPAAPDRLTVTPVAPGALRLDWADNSANETHFLIERSLDGGVSFTALGSTGPNAGQYVDAELGPKVSCRYRVCASNAGGASAYSNAVDGATLPAQPILALAGPLPRQVVQRGSANLGSVPVAGTVSEGVDRVEARAVKMEGATGMETDWTPVATAADFRDGAFDGRLGVAAGGWYEIQVRAGARGVVVATASVPRVGVGEVFVVCGQSNSANYGRPAQGPTDDRVSALARFGWQFGSDPQPLAHGTDGSPWPRLGELLVNELQVPVAFASTGVGGTASADWLPSGRFYGWFAAVLQRLGPGGERAVLWHQGETDAARKVGTETYRQNLAAIIQASRRDAGWAVPWVVAGVAYEPATPPAWRAAVRAAQSRLWAEGTALEGPETDSLAGYAYRWDGEHFTRAGLFAHAARWLKKLRGHFFNPGASPPM